MRRLFIFSFGLLQNSTSLESFENIFEKIITVFSSKFINEDFLLSYDQIKSEIEAREIVTKIVSDNCFDVRSIDFTSTKNYIFRSNEKIYKILKNESPFKMYFNSKIEDLKKKISKQDDIMLNVVNKKQNLYYSPNFLEVIYDLIHILPLWTGTMLTEWENRFPKYKLPTRLTNNPVENHFKITKHSTLGRRKVMPSERSSRCYNHLESKYIQFYEKREKNNIRT